MKVLYSVMRHHLYPEGNDLNVHTHTHTHTHTLHVIRKLSLLLTSPVVKLQIVF